MGLIDIKVGAGDTGLTALLFKHFSKRPSLFFGGLLGAIGIINVLDSAITDHLGVTWVLVPEWGRPVLQIVRDLWRPIIEWAIQYLPFELSDPLKDYFLMGTIVAGMRYRSSMVIWKSLLRGDYDRYEQPTIFPGREIILEPGQKSKFYFLFLPVRLSYAFFLWPKKLFGATFRFSRGEWRQPQTSQPTTETSQSVTEAIERQYVTFFSAVFMALFLMFIFLLF